MKTSESKFASCLYFTCNALARKVEKMAIECWKPVQLSPSHGYLLMMVLEDPGVGAGNIADNLQLKPSTVTRLLEKLEEKKLIVRITEGKQTTVFATNKAKQLLPALKKCVENFYNLYSEALGKQVSNSFVNNLHEISDKL